MVFSGSNIHIILIYFFQNGPGIPQGIPPRGMMNQMMVGPHGMRPGMPMMRPHLGGPPPVRPPGQMNVPPPQIGGLPQLGPPPMNGPQQMGGPQQMNGPPIMGPPPGLNGPSMSVMPLGSMPMGGPQMVPPQMGMGGPIPPQMGGSPQIGGPRLDIAQMLNVIKQSTPTG